MTLDGILGLFCFVASWILINGGIGAAIGANKGSAAHGFCWGILLGPVGWLVAALSDFRPQCPTCDQQIGKDAKVCPWCGTRFAD